jgi:hypothetical protein
LLDRRPTLIEIIVFGETISILGILAGLIYVPLVYDYIRRNKMGTYGAGASLVAKLTAFFRSMSWACSFGATRCFLNHPRAT